MFDNNVELSRLLDVTHTLPVVIDPQGPIPSNSQNYLPVLNVVNHGFEFTVRELLHAIGCKTAALPMSEADECLKSAYIYIHLLDLHSNPLSFKDGIDQDLKSMRSQQIGIGMTCLFASRHYSIPWDQLESIPGRELRFDYRGRSNGLQCIFESKGTVNQRSQSAQITHGIDKKNAHHNRGEHFDVELIISTHIGERGEQPRILLADPDFSNFSHAFDDALDDVYSLRHYARVFQFIGMPWIARRFYMSAKRLLQGKTIGEAKSELVGQDYQADKVIVGNDTFIGNWYSSWIPEDSKRYDHFSKYKLPELRTVEKIRIFQGLRVDIYETLLSEDFSSIVLLSDDMRKSYQLTDDGMLVSVFPDATILGIDATRKYR